MPCQQQGRALKPLSCQLQPARRLEVIGTGTLKLADNTAQVRRPQCFFGHPQRLTVILCRDNEQPCRIKPHHGQPRPIKRSQIMSAGALGHPHQGPRLTRHKPAAKRHGKPCCRGHIRVGRPHHLMQPGQGQTGTTTQTPVNLRHPKQERRCLRPPRLKA